MHHRAMHQMLNTTLLSAFYYKRPEKRIDITKLLVEKIEKSFLTNIMNLLMNKTGKKKIKQ